MSWCKTTLKDIGEALEFVQDIGFCPETMEVKGFSAFKVWMNPGWMTFAQPNERRVVAYTPPNIVIAYALQEWKSPNDQL